MFEIITTWIRGIDHAGGSILVLVENVFPSIPSGLSMSLAGYLPTEGQLWLPATILAGTIGSVLVELFWYYIGVWIGEKRLQRFAARHGACLTISAKDVACAGSWFRNHGRRAVFIGRVVPGVRSLISVPAGLAGIPLKPFLVFTTLGNLAWTGVLVGAGYVLHSQYETVAARIDPISTGVLFSLIGVYLFRLIRQLLRRKPKAR